MIRPLGRGATRERPGPVAEVTVLVGDDQDAHPIDLGTAEALARSVLAAEGVTGPAELSVTFIDEDAMAELNAAHMGETGPTDVLAFPIDAGPDPGDLVEGDPERLLGDVVICPAVAARNAPEHAGTFGDEIALLIVHGTLHVLGWEHATAAETTVMAARERDLLGATAGSPS